MEIQVSVHIMILIYILIVEIEPEWVFSWNFKTEEIVEAHINILVLNLKKLVRSKWMSVGHDSVFESFFSFLRHFFVSIIGPRGLHNGLVLF